MQLTATQLQTIETYLLSWKLQFRDFYDEMFDHFCTEIEQRMINGDAFDEAFSDTSYLFSGHEYEPKAIFNLPSLKPRYFGPKAFEMEWHDTLRKRNNSELRHYIAQQFISFRAIIWLAVYLSLYAVSTAYNLTHLWLILLIIPFFMHFISLMFMIIKERGIFKFVYLFTIPSPDANRHDSKSTLHGTGQTLFSQFYMMVFSLGLLLNGSRVLLESVQIPLWVCCGVTVAFSMLVTAQLEVIKQFRKNKHSTYS